MEITNPPINDYITAISLSAKDEQYNSVLREMEEYAQKNNFPIIGPIVGRFLRQMAIAVNARNIFEMGSGYGYSAVWFAGGLSDGGKIICTEGSEANRQRALSHFKQAGRTTRLGCESKIEFHVGDAKDIIKKYDGPFDIILNDIDKEQYTEAFDLAVPRLRKGGIFITDNVLWSGKILDSEPDEATRGIIEFNRKLFNSKDVFSSIMPIRDGLGLAVRV